MSEDKVEHQAVQTPLQDLLRGVPRDHVLEIEMKDDEGRVYGHQMIPVGLYSHEAADKIDSAEFFKKRIEGLSESLSHVLSRAGG